MQTILGANGVIATELAKALASYTKSIRLVSRHPNKVNDTDTLLSADLLDREQTIRACEGSEVVYLTAGIKYDATVWEQQWPVIMSNVIAGCKKAGAKLVFFSNVYSLGLVKGWMTEASPIKPSSRKGKVRARVEEMILTEVKNGTLDAIIARAPDFYGPNCNVSVAQVLVFDNLAKGKTAQWLVSGSKLHSMIFTPDAGKATALLGNTPSAFNRVWNLPTARPALNGKEFVSLAAKALNKPDKLMVLPTWMLYITSLFMPVMRALLEMLYQNNVDYLFDSSEFEHTFNFRPTSYEEGIARIAQTYPQTDKR